MKIERINTNQLCKMQDCTDVAQYSILINKKFLPIKLNICQKHLKEIYGIIAKQLTPKSPKNIIKKGEN